MRGATGKSVPCADRVEKHAHCGGSNGDGSTVAVVHAQQRCGERMELQGTCAHIVANGSRWIDRRREEGSSS